VDGKKYFWRSIYDASQVSRFKVQMELTEHDDGERYWRNEWTRAQDPKRVSPATLDRHRLTAIAFCLAETATKKTTKVVPSEHDAHLAETSRLHNEDQDGGGCLVTAEDTRETQNGGFTYRLNVGDDALPSERKARERWRSSQGSSRKGSRKSRNKIRGKDDRTMGDRGTCVSS
jgi:hypothetical protein